MKRIIYQVAVGAKSRLYEHCIASVAAYCKQHKALQGPEKQVNYILQTIKNSTWTREPGQVHLINNQNM